MIYEFPGEDEPIRQGDIFVGVPRIDVSLEELPVMSDGEAEVCRWEELASGAEPVLAVATVKPVAAIVVSQDCDAAYADDITLCEIRDFRDVERKCKDTQVPKSWMRIITQQAKLNQKWFYLPPESSIGFTDRMGVDFPTTIRVCRQELEDLRHLRRGRLIRVALEHFRERIAEFYRRYPVDEWYPLTADEFAEYAKEHPDASPFPWQSSNP